MHTVLLLQVIVLRVNLYYQRIMFMLYSKVQYTVLSTLNCTAMIAVRARHWPVMAGSCRNTEHNTGRCRDWRAGQGRMGLSPLASWFLFWTKHTSRRVLSGVNTELILSEQNTPSLLWAPLSHCHCAVFKLRFLQIVQIDYYDLMW